jgi:hypothetical protein
MISHACICIVDLERRDYDSVVLQRCDREASMPSTAEFFFAILSFPCICIMSHAGRLHHVGSSVQDKTGSVRTSHTGFIVHSCSPCIVNCNSRLKTQQIWTSSCRSRTGEQTPKEYLVTKPHLAASGYHRGMARLPLHCEAASPCFSPSRSDAGGV